MEDTVSKWPIHPGLLMAETPEQKKALTYIWNASQGPMYDVDHFGIDS